jgi:SET domain-containing protein
LATETDLGPFVHPYLEIKTVPGKGRGVFARRDLPRDFLLERAPIIEIPPNDWELIEKTVLHHYAFGWGVEQDRAAIALGLGSLINHSYEPNAYYQKCLEERVIEFITLTPIRAGEEITVNYSGHPYARKPLWFKVQP